MTIYGRARVGELVAAGFGAIPGLVFLVSAGLKAWSPDSLVPMLNFALVPPSMQAGSTLALIGAEAALGMALLVFASSGVRLTALGVIAVFTGVLATMLLVAEPPSCGCFGAVRLFDSARTELLFGIGRNMVVAGVLVRLLATAPVGEQLDPMKTLPAANLTR